MNRLVAAAVAVLAVSSTGAAAASLLSEQQARAKAIGILLGDPYGGTTAEVAGNIKDAQLRRDRKTEACGATNAMAWEFHVVVVTPNKDQFNNGVIDGYLAIHAGSGALLCTNLPLLD